MTEDTWNRQAARLAAAWPTPVMDDARRAVYFEVLADLDDASVEAAVTELLREDRPDLPPPGAIKRRAEDHSTGAEPEREEDGSASESKADKDAREREGRRPWLGAFFGFFGIFPVALWLGIKSLKDRKRAHAEGRAYEGFGAAIAAIVLGSVSVIALLVVLIGYLPQDSPNDGDYLTRAELETSIVEEGQFGQGDQQLRVTSATCVEDIDEGRRYRCLVEFRGGFQSSYTVTVARDGTWVAQ